jgi:hypothetical protein
LNLTHFKTVGSEKPLPIKAGDLIGHIGFYQDCYVERPLSLRSVTRAEGEVVLRHLLLCFSLVGYNFSVESSIASEKANEQGESLGSDLVYGEPIGERYLTLALLFNGEVVRTLRGNQTSGGAYQRRPVLSPDGAFALVSQVESTNVEGWDGATTYHEVAYCNLIELSTGCIAERDTGQFCSGSFTRDGKWKTSIYPDISLAEVKPSALDYSSGKRVSADSPALTFDNLLACDPIDANNVDTYRTIIEKNIFDLDPVQREGLERALKDRRLVQPAQMVE